MEPAVNTFDDLKKSILQNWQDNRDYEQSLCTHTKGGNYPRRNWIYEGNDHCGNRSVAKHRLPMGGIFVVCTRCGKEWHPPEIGRPATEGWEQAVNFHTDNEMSESVQFVFTPKYEYEYTPIVEKTVPDSIWTRFKKFILRTLTLITAKGEK